MGDAQGEGPLLCSCNVLRAQGCKVQGVTSAAFIPLQEVQDRGGLPDRLPSEIGRRLGPLLDSEYIAIAAFLPFLEAIVHDRELAAAGALPATVRLLNGSMKAAQVRCACMPAVLAPHEPGPHVCGLFEPPRTMSLPLACPL